MPDIVNILASGQFSSLPEAERRKELENLLDIRPPQLLEQFNKALKTPFWKKLNASPASPDDLIPCFMAVAKARIQLGIVNAPFNMLEELAQSETAEDFFEHWKDPAYTQIFYDVTALPSFEEMKHTDPMSRVVTELKKEIVFEIHRRRIERSISGQQNKEAIQEALKNFKVFELLSLDFSQLEGSELAKLETYAHKKLALHLLKTIIFPVSDVKELVMLAESSSVDAMQHCVKEQLLDGNEFANPGINQETIATLQLAAAQWAIINDLSFNEGLLNKVASLSTYNLIPDLIRKENLGTFRNKDQIANLMNPPTSSLSKQEITDSVYQMKLVSGVLLGITSASQEDKLSYLTDVKTALQEKYDDRTSELLNNSACIKKVQTMAFISICKSLILNASDSSLDDAIKQNKLYDYLAQPKDTVFQNFSLDSLKALASDPKTQEILSSYSQVHNFLVLAERGDIKFEKVSHIFSSLNKNPRPMPYTYLTAMDLNDFKLKLLQATFRSDTQNFEKIRSLALAKTSNDFASYLSQLGFERASGALDSVTQNMIRGMALEASITNILKRLDKDFDIEGRPAFLGLFFALSLHQRQLLLEPKNEAILKALMVANNQSEVQRLLSINHSPAVDRLVKENMQGQKSSWGIYNAVLEEIIKKDKNLNPNKVSLLGLNRLLLGEGANLFGEGKRQQTTELIKRLLNIELNISDDEYQRLEQEQARNLPYIAFMQENKVQKQTVEARKNPNGVAFCQFMLTVEKTSPFVADKDVVSHFCDAIEQANDKEACLRALETNVKTQGEITDAFKLAFTDQVFNQLKRTFRKNDAVNISIDALNKTMDETLKPLNQRLNDLRRVNTPLINSLQRLGNLEDIPWLSPIFLNRSTTHAHAQMKRFHVISGAVDACLNELSYQRSVLKKQLEELPEANARFPSDTQREAILNFKQQIQAHLNRVQEEIELYEPIQKKLRGDPAARTDLLRKGILTAIQSVLDNDNYQEVIFPRLGISIKDVPEDNIPATQSIALTTSTSITSPGSPGSTFELGKGSVPPHHVRVYTLSGGSRLVEKKNPRLTTEKDFRTLSNDNHVIYKAPTSYRLENMPKPQTSQDDTLSNSRELVAAYMDAAFVYYSKLQEPLTKDNQAFLRGNNPFEVGMLWTALMILIENDAYLKSDPKGISVHCAVNSQSQATFDPDSQLSSKPFVTFAKGSYHDMFFKQHSDIIKERVAALNEYRDAQKAQEKAYKQVVSDAEKIEKAVLTGELKGVLSEIREAEQADATREQMRGPTLH